MTLKSLLVTCGLVLATFSAQPHSYKIAAIEIGHPWSRPTVTGQSVGGGYLKLNNTGAADKLLSATADVAASVEMHTMTMDGQVMRMRQVDAIELPAGQTVELKPGGFHLMFMGLKAPFKEGDKFPLKLKFEKAGEVTVEINVEQPKAAPSEHKH